jgi:hypothetical protein
MSNHEIIATLNAVRVLKRDDGKFGLEEAFEGAWSGEISWRYGSESSAMNIARAMSDENDRIDAHCAKHS